MLQICIILEAFWQHKIDFLKANIVKYWGKNCHLRVKLSQYQANFKKDSTDLRTILSNFVATDIYILFNSPLEKSATWLYKTEGWGGWGGITGASRLLLTPTGTLRTPWGYKGLEQISGGEKYIDLIRGVPPN